MTTKEYLNQANYCERKIKLLKREIEKMRSLSVSLSVRYDNERVQSSGEHDKMASTVARIVDRENILADLINGYIEKKEILETQLSVMNNKFYADVLYGRCVAGLSFFDLSYQIGKKRRQTINIYNKALMAFESQFYDYYKDMEQDFEKYFQNEE